MPKNSEAPEAEAPETQGPEAQGPETQAPEAEAPEAEAPEAEAPEIQEVKEVIFKVKELATSKNQSVYAIGNAILALFQNSPPILKQENKLQNHLNLLLQNKDNFLSDSRYNENVKFEIEVTAYHKSNTPKILHLNISEILSIAESCNQVQDYFRNMEAMLNPQMVKSVTEFPDLFKLE